MICRRKPDPEWLRAQLAAWHEAPLSYAHRGGVNAPPESGFIVDEHAVRLGSGDAVFRAGGAALDAWWMFPEWAAVHPLGVKQELGTIVAMVMRLCGRWWVNPCRILSRCDSERTHGFVYGTLPEHAECGEEMFAVERWADGSVWYVIRAFSRPRHWLAWLGFPLARWWQLRFVRDSQERMKEAVQP